MLFGLQQQRSGSGSSSGSGGGGGSSSTGNILHGNTFMCSVCCKSFLSGWELRRHLHAHADARPFHCPYCSHRSNFKHNLKSHIRSIHPGQPFTFTVQTQAADDA
ncbi:hypothetical protein Pmani_018724 [Petrolisthes manimaculis]|uniref:C2H2-type domain-containing protein n=1 Tax=Petrolisthes manimaculis TaxID=1843537 RepID=A0AAE1PJP3_9EUCA|nr:hypothetical protein Pmani_018724 [Petrolisthes manimaculis]